MDAKGKILRAIPRAADGLMSSKERRARLREIVDQALKGLDASSLEVKEVKLLADMELAERKLEHQIEQDRLAAALDVITPEMARASLAKTLGTEFIHAR